MDAPWSYGVFEVEVGATSAQKVYPAFEASGACWATEGNEIVFCDIVEAVVSPYMGYRGAIERGDLHFVRPGGGHRVVSEDQGYLAAHPTWQPLPGGALPRRLHF